ncbi:MAG: Rne/Rng family ribonuclease [Acidobacteriota bacterium]|nr:Rne/Rng family ribonuclease [Acidobacteriota bacterium]
MAKEMIVSVNGREKKIAILEDGKVTEFYIERGEENSGVVGNIYKGRVMRVLPGMQSAFVDIGLERDAFLYVSDFFDEEEEFERIVMEKKQKGEAADAAKAAADRVQKARLERERQIEAAQERAEPIAAAVAEPEIEELPELPEEFLPEEFLPEDTAEEGFVTIEDEIEETDSSFIEIAAPKNVELKSIEEIETATPFVAGESSFERIVDDETEGDLFKEARVQERIADQVRAVEFEIEPTPPMAVGSLRFDIGNGGLERIADEDEPAASPTTGAAAQSEKGKRGRGRRGGKKQQPAEPETVTEVTAPAAEAPVVEAPAEETSKETGGKRGSRRGGKKNAATNEQPQASETTATKSEKSSRRSGRGGKNRKNNEGKMQTENPGNNAEDGANVESTQNSRGETRESSNVENPSRAERADSNTEGTVQNERGNTDISSPADAMTGNYDDSDASVDDLGAFRSEMAVRRGGRGRRGARGGNRPQRGGQNGAGQDENLEAGETEETAVETVEAADTNSEDNGRAPKPQREDRRGGQRGGQERGERAERSDRGERPERSERGDRGGRRQQTITDLLREGQEILVQIAKEPIAKKGARITSHIALPGRYLVYMPTIEHVGVSRKIESGSERNRLRALIQKIRDEEDVPSGGFIVRTAGIGISEQNLREDARYLVRTWTDVRKVAERAKSPAMVHQDLDLVERILRDQLSDDFAAIRVDDEAEFQRVVEFINRMAPRMTNRVKLFTRDEPIMEAYGVQEEIDKAVKPRVWLKSGGYLVINQTEALVSIDVNTGKFVGKGANRLEDTITKTNMEAVEEIARQIRLRDLGGIIVLDLIDMEDRRNRQKVLQSLQEALAGDKSPTKVLSFNDFGLIVMTRKRVKQSLERTLCAPCHYCQGAGLIKSAQTVAYEILDQSRRLSRQMDDYKQVTLRVHPEIAKALRTTERDVLNEIEDYLGSVDLTADAAVHQEQFDFAFI